MENLNNIHPDLDYTIRDFAFLAKHYSHFHPGNAGDVSQVLAKNCSKKILEIFSKRASDWFSFSSLEKLSSIRRDGRTGYRSEGVSDKSIIEKLKNIAGHVVLITTTGAQLPAIKHTLSIKKRGRYFNLVEVSDDGLSIRILYGNREYGTIPSIETHMHLLGNSLSINEGIETPAVVHAHTPAMVSLSRHPAINGSFKLFNSIIYTQIEGLLRNYSNCIGIIPYYESGSEKLVQATLPVLSNHQIVIWMNHGCVVRAKNIRRGYTLLSYAENAAKASMKALSLGLKGLPEKEVEPFLKEHDLWKSYNSINAKLAIQR